MRPPRLSVRARLTAWHALVLTLIVCVFSAGIIVFVKVRLYDELDRQLARELAAIERVYREEPGELGDLAAEWGMTLFQVTERGAPLHRTEAWERVGLAQATVAGEPASWTARDGRTYRMRTASGPSWTVAAAIDETPTRDTLWTLAAVLLAGGPFAAVLALAGGYFLAGRVLRPVGAMADQAKKISAESLAERLPVDNPHDEFGRLATVLNESLARVQDAFERLRRFTADASHELRTPLTAMRSVGEVAMQRAVEPAACRDAIGSMLEEVDRLTRLVDSLLVLTRADSGALKAVREPVDLAALASGVVEQLRVLAEEKQQSLVLEVSAPVGVRCDATLARQALTNLVHNAIKYTPARGAIRVAVSPTPTGGVAIEVRDDGPGIAARHRERIFERFYRVDAGRSRDEGGVGLGLAIARRAVEASGGRIELESEEGRGSVFRIVLPD